MWCLSECLLLSSTPFLRFSIDLFLFEKFLMNFPFCVDFLDLLLPFRWFLVSVNAKGWVGVTWTLFTLFNKVIIFPANNWFFKNAENPLSRLSHLFVEQKTSKNRVIVCLTLKQLSRNKFIREIIQRSINVIMNKKFHSTSSFLSKQYSTGKILKSIIYDDHLKIKGRGFCVSEETNMPIFLISDVVGGAKRNLFGEVEEMKRD